MWHETDPGTFVFHQKETIQMTEIQNCGGGNVKKLENIKERNREGGRERNCYNKKSLYFLSGFSFSLFSFSTTLSHPLIHILFTMISFYFQCFSVFDPRERGREHTEAVRQTLTGFIVKE